jgi:hypothetical protein
MNDSGSKEGEDQKSLSRSTAFRLPLEPIYLFHSTVYYIQNHLFHSFIQHSY